MSKQCQWSFCFTITSGADDNEGAFSEAFRLEPGLAATASVLGRGKFRDNAFELVISAGLKERSSIPGELLTEQKRVFTRNKLSKLSPSLQQWVVAEIPAVQVEKVEGTEHQPLRTPTNC